MNRALLRTCPPCSCESTRPTLVSALSLLCRCEQLATGRPPSFDRSVNGSDPGDVRPRPHEGVRHCLRRRLPRRVQEVRCCCFRLEVLPQPTPTFSSRSPRGMVTPDVSRSGRAVPSSWSRLRSNVGHERARGERLRPTGRAPPGARSRRPSGRGRSPLACDRNVDRANHGVRRPAAQNRASRGHREGTPPGNAKRDSPALITSPHRLRIVRRCAQAAG